MLATQMLSVHQLQQRPMVCTNTADDLELKRYYTNATIKLANCFIQQAKMIVERVDVYQGGQAIVGNIQSATDNKDKK